MRHMIRNVFHSPKFVWGFGIFVFILIFCIVYPLFNPGNPLEMLQVGGFAAPGTYVNVYDTVAADINKEETLKIKFRLPGADEKRLESVLSADDRNTMLKFLAKVGVDTSEVDVEDLDQLLELWEKYFDPTSQPKGITRADWNKYKRINNAINRISSTDRRSVSEKDQDGQMAAVGDFSSIDYVSVDEVANHITLPLGTDNFGRDMLKELVSATLTSVEMGFIAGTVATIIGLLFGLLAGYVGGVLDDIITFITNLFTVIPGFVLLILISFSIGQEQRGVTTVALVIGLTGWTWTARSVRSQVISLRNRDHVNLSKLSGHSLFRIILSDILPYIMSYVVMAFILQVSSGILSEAQLSLLGLGPKSTETPTLGLMMNWSMLYKAHTSGYWWAYFPIILTIAGVSFSLNLMNTGLDQVFNPALRD
ncbi:MAG: ABC transporter permease [Clostridiales bacterium]|nr:ABC transporter permease [Clostridiales bacterium]